MERFWGDSLNKNTAWLLDEESIHLKVLWKTSASKTYKSSHQQVSSEITVLIIQTSHNRLYKI